MHVLAVTLICSAEVPYLQMLQAWLHYTLAKLTSCTQRRCGYVTSVVIRGPVQYVTL